MTFWFLKMLEHLMNAEADISGMDLAVKLLLSGNDCEAKRATADVIGDLTLDEYDGSGYAEYNPGAPSSISIDATNLRVEVAVSAGSWGATVSAATSSAVGYLVYDKTSGYVLGYTTEGFPLNGDGGPLSLTPDADAGLLSLA